MPFGDTTYFFDALPSTNDYASELIAQQEVTEGTIIDTAHQTQGHGQKSRVWYSSANENITLSLILTPHWLPIESQFLLNLMASLAIVDTVAEKTGRHGQVKWPNDVYINGKKISGILIKNQLQGSRIQSSIIGIGLNVLQNEWPEEVTKATSIVRESGHEISLDETKSLLLSNLEDLYDEIKTDPNNVIERYNQLLLFKDELVQFVYQNNSQNGIIKSIDRYGRLLIEQSGDLNAFGYGEITFH